MRSELKARFSLLPILFSIAVYVFVIDQIYIWTEGDLFLTNSLSTSIALGAILTGFFSDLFCRRLMLLVVHGLGILLFILVYLYENSFFFVFMLGLFYNPLSIVRANLIDNAPTYSKIKLISWSFIVQFAPEAAYFLYVNLSRNQSFMISLGGVLLSFFVGLIFFFDRRDEKIKGENNLTKMARTFPKIESRALFTFAAFIPTQIAYFVSDNLLEVYSLNPLYYSILAFGSLIGALISTLYRKTPHVSVLTIVYGLCLLLACLPVAALFLYQYTRLDIPFMFVALGSLLGFYIPFVYDVILRSVEKRFRGTSCGVIDFVYSGSSLVTLLLFRTLLLKIEMALILVAIAFAFSVALQKISE